MYKQEAHPWWKLKMEIINGNFLKHESDWKFLLGTDEATPDGNTVSSSGLPSTKETWT